MKRVFTILLFSVLFFSCGSKKKVVTKKKEIKNEKVEVAKKEEIKQDTSEKPVTAPIINSTTEYITAYKDIAISEMKRSGVPASITLAQGILESGSGRGRLATKANNHFGIKCHGWKGGKIYHDDDAKQECFRKYKSAEGSFRDHSEFLTNRKRYAKLFTLNKENYKGWAKELRKAGYATDKKYPQKLISLIERYKLYKYDDVDIIGDKKESVKPQKHIVVKGDTLYSISRLYNTTVDQLKKVNKLKSSDIAIGDVLYLEE